MQNMFGDIAGGGGAQGEGQGDNVPIWMKYAGKGAGVIGGCGKSQRYYYYFNFRALGVIVTIRLGRGHRARHGSKCICFEP